MGWESETLLGSIVCAICNFSLFQRARVLRLANENRPKKSSKFLHLLPPCCCAMFRGWNNLPACSLKIAYHVHVTSDLHLLSLVLELEIIALFLSFLISTACWLYMFEIWNNFLMNFACLCDDDRTGGAVRLNFDTCWFFYATSSSARRMHNTNTHMSSDIYEKEIANEILPHSSLSLLESLV